MPEQPLLWPLPWQADEGLVLLLAAGVSDDEEDEDGGGAGSMMELRRPLRFSAATTPADVTADAATAFRQHSAQLAQQSHYGQHHVLIIRFIIMMTKTRRPDEHYLPQ